MVPILCYPQTKSCQNIVVFIYFNSHLPYANYAIFTADRFPGSVPLRFGSVRVGITVRTCYGSCRFGSCGSIRFTGTLDTSNWIEACPQCPSPTTGNWAAGSWASWLPETRTSARIARSFSARWGPGENHGKRCGASLLSQDLCGVPQLRLRLRNQPNRQLKKPEALGCCRVRLAMDGGCCNKKSASHFFKIQMRCL